MTTALVHMIYKSTSKSNLNIILSAILVSLVLLSGDFTFNEKNNETNTAYAEEAASDFSEIPQWVTNVSLWLEQGKVSPQEFADMISYLKQKKLITIDNDSLKELRGSAKLQDKSNSSDNQAGQATLNPDYEIKTTKGTKHVVSLDAIVSGGPPKDGIPSIDNPKFVPADDAEFLSGKDVVVGVSYNDDTKAYPLSILVWHEIVNDKLGDIPVAVTYCPLCYSSNVFVRMAQGQEVEFGVSGKLYNNNLVM